MTVASNAWLTPYREKLIMRGKYIALSAFARQVVLALMFLTLVFLFTGEWSA